MKGVALHLEPPLVLMAIAPPVKLQRHMLRLRSKLAMLTMALSSILEIMRWALLSMALSRVPARPYQQRVGRVKGLPWCERWVPEVPAFWSLF